MRSTPARGRASARTITAAGRRTTRKPSPRDGDADGRSPYDAGALGVRRVIVVVVVASAVLGGCGGSAAPRQATPSPTPTPLDSGSAPVQRPRVPTGPHDAPVPILMYHVIAAAPPGAAYADLWVSPDAFAHQIAALAHAGYHATTLDAVWRAWHGHGTMPLHPIVLSFDDGYQSQSTHARRALDRLGWPGVLNLAVKNVGVAGGLSRGEVRAMMRDGWEIDAHTLTHVDLTTVDRARLVHEVAGSRAWLHRAFGVPVDFFCYPAGRYDAAVEATVHAAGYLGATTTNAAMASHEDDPFAMPRVRVGPQMTAADLVAVLHRLGATSARPS
jgi:peptidoglycan/xylan/chitin deacetylase (PgdA/CDA1 family)